MTDISPLCKAAWLGNLRSIKMLLAKGQNVNERCGDLGLTPLMFAAKECKEKAVASLLQKGAKVNLRTRKSSINDFMSNWTALHFAINFPTRRKQAQLTIVEMLIEAGAHVNCRDSSGMTPLMGTAGKPQLAKLLIEHGAFVNAADNEGNTALFYWRSWASPARMVAQIKALMDNGANIYHKNLNGERCYDSIISVSRQAGFTKLMDILAVHQVDKDSAEGQPFHGRNGQYNRH